MPDAWIGDALLAFDARIPTGGRSDAPWRRAHTAGGATLWLQETAPGWRGFPSAAVSAGRWRLWLVGELYPPGCDAAAVLSRFAAGELSAADLNGHFLLVGFDATSGTWHVWTDRFGTVHAYRRGRDVATCSRLLTPAGGALDWVGLATFFALGFFTGDRTYLADVRILRPATHTALGVTSASERYWQWAHRPRPRDLRTAAGEFGELFTEVMGDHAGHGRVAVPISGGLDSRTTVAFLAEADVRRVWSYSYGYGTDSIETEIAAQVARARNLDFQELSIPEYLAERLGAVIGCVEGFQDVTQARQAAVTDQLAARADYVIAAHWGDVWHDTMGALDAPPGADVVSLALKKLAKRGSSWLLEHIVARHLDAPVDEVVRAEVARELAALAHIEEPDFRIKALKTDQWSFRWTLASLRMYQAGAFPRLPFYDTRVSDYFAELPSALVDGRQLQVEAIKRFAPDLARVRWQSAGTNLHWYKHARVLGLPRRATRKVIRTVRQRPVLERNWEVQLLSPTGRMRLEGIVLDGDGPLAAHVGRAQVQPLLHDLYVHRRPETGYAACMLLTFGLWLEWAR